MITTPQAARPISSTPPIPSGDPPRTSSVGTGSLLPTPMSAQQTSDFGQGMDLMFRLMALLQSNSIDQQKQQIEASSTVKTNLLLAQQQQQLDDLKKQSGEGFFEGVGNVLAHSLKDVFTFNISGLVGDTIKDVKAMMDSPRFCEDLKKVCAAVGEAVAIVVGAAVTVCSFGSASPAAVVLIAASTVLCTAAFVEQNFHVLEAAGVDEKTAGWIGIGCAVGGAIAGLAGGAAGGATAAVEAAQATVDVAGGVATALSAAHTYDSDHAHIAAIAARQVVARMQRLIEGLVDDVKTSANDSSHTKARMTEALQTYFDSRMIPLTGVRA